MKKSRLALAHGGRRVGGADLFHSRSVARLRGAARIFEGRFRIEIGSLGAAKFSHSWYAYTEAGFTVARQLTPLNP